MSDFLVRLPILPQTVFYIFLFCEWTLYPRQIAKFLPLLCIRRRHLEFFFERYHNNGIVWYTDVLPLDVRRNISNYNPFITIFWGISLHETNLIMLCGENFVVETFDSYGNFTNQFYFVKIVIYLDFHRLLEVPLKIVYSVELSTQQIKYFYH